jgi:phospholipid transport system substrate-binding protein
MGRTAIFLMVCLFAAGTPQAQEETPTDVIEGLQAALISVMKEAKALGYEGRYQRLDPVIRETHDLQSIARIALGRHWGKLDDKQRREFIDTFAQLSIATYAYQFDEYSGERFEIVETKPFAGTDQVVHARLIKASGAPVKFDYIMRRADGGWRIVNIVVDGVSDLALKRAEYTSVMRDQGFEALVSQLRQKVQDYAGGQAGDDGRSASLGIARPIRGADKLRW